MPQTNNPAGRLYAILAEAKQVHDHVKPKTMWAEMFGASPDDTAEVLAYFVQVVGLVAQTRRAIESLSDVDKDAYLRPIVQIERAFSKANLEAQCAEFKGIVSEIVMTGLEFCSDKLARTNGDGVVDESILDDLRKEIEGLIADILGSEMDESVKAVILDHLEAVRRAILTYRIYGASGIKRALDSGVGSLLRHAGEIAKPENKKWMPRLLNVFQKIDSYVTFGQGAKRLFGHVVELLQLGN